MNNCAVSKEQAISLYAAAGFALFEVYYDNEGRKIPAHKRWQHVPNDPFIDPARFDGKPYGVVLRDDVLVVDYDPRRDINGKSSLQLLFQHLDIPTPVATFIVRTGGGGAHIYFRKPRGFIVHAEVPRYPAIDLKTGGGWVVGVGSNHPSGNIYECVRGSILQLADCPSALLAWCEKKQDLHQTDAVVDDSPAVRSRFITYAFNCPPAIEGSGGNNHTYKVACEGRGYGLSAESVIEIMCDYFNPRCIPEWDHSDLQRIVLSAYENAKSAPGEFHPANEWTAAKVAEITKLTQPAVNAIDRPARTMAWDINKRTGETKDSLGNCLNYFNPQLPIITNDGTPNPLLELVRYNQFNDEIELLRPAPWHNKYDQSTLWTDADTIRMAGWVNEECHFIGGIGNWENALLIESRKRQYHPVREWLDTLVWDGQPRLDKWLTTYAGAPPVPYIYEVGKNTLIAAIARVYKPGAKHDTVLVLEGRQGTGKSTLVATLGGDWYVDSPINPHDKDTVVGFRGSWIAEMGEMETIKRSDVQALRAFISRTTDRVRPAYARRHINLPRQFIFIGTINPVEGGYLKDPAGNRRFWPVATNNIDIPALSRDRSQLFAEAKHRYDQGESWHIENQALEFAAKQEQEARQTSEVWTNIIGDWLVANNLPDKLKIHEVAYQALNLPYSQFSKEQSVRIHNALRVFGYEARRVYHNGKQERLWCREDYDETRGI